MAAASSFLAFEADALPPQLSFIRFHTEFSLGQSPQYLSRMYFVAHTVSIKSVCVCVCVFFVIHGVLIVSAIAFDLLRTQYQLSGAHTMYRDKKLG